MTSFVNGTFCFSAYSLERPYKEEHHEFRGDVDKDVYTIIKTGFDQVCHDRAKQLGL